MISDAPSQTIVSESKPNAFPSALRAKRSAVRTLTAGDQNQEATIQETCPKCGRPEMRFFTLQLRSADEGSTVFYTCECGYKYDSLTHSRIGLTAFIDADHLRSTGSVQTIEFLIALFIVNSSDSLGIVSSVQTRPSLMPPWGWAPEPEHTLLPPSSRTPPCPTQR